MNKMVKGRWIKKVNKKREKNNLKIQKKKEDKNYIAKPIGDALKKNQILSLPFT